MSREIVREEAALRAREARYRLLADAADDFVQVADATGRTLYPSPPRERRLGFVVDTMARSPPACHPDDLEVIRRAKAANLAGKATSIE